MKNIIIISIVLALMLVTVPASALTLDSLYINIGDEGDTALNLEYSLNWIEKIAVFMKISDPAYELQNALEGHSNKGVDVTSVSDGGASFVVYGFAQVTDSGDAVTYRTPELSFSNAEDVMKGYWFAPLISIDLSPAETTIRFPDGYEEKFYNDIEIPSISHDVMK